MKIVFFGTPQFAVLPLKMLFESKKHEILAVVTQPDRAKNRKGEYIFSPIKQAATDLDLQIFQFESVKNAGDVLRSLGADIFVTAGYGQLFSQEILDIPPHGVVNIHASLLPEYRGSSPIQWAIMNGERVSGVTIMRTDLGLDTGDILSQKECEIAPEDTTASLSEKLSEIGAKLLIDTLEKLENGQIRRQKQDEKLATKFPLINRETGRLDFSLSAKKLHDTTRAIDCHTTIDGKYVKILRTSVGGDSLGFSAGEICEIGEEICVACGDGVLKISVLQPENKRQMSAREFLLGNKLEVGAKIG